MNLRLTVPLLMLALLAGACTARPDSLDDQKLSGLAVKNLAQPKPGILTAGQPTPEQFEALAQLGVARFINLRTDVEAGTGWEAEAAARLGVQYVHIPVSGGEDINEANARALADALEGDATTLVYCGSSNRVGALMGLKARVVDGVSIEDAQAFGRACGATKLESVLTERLDATRNQ